MCIRVIRPGLLTTIQDLGRFGVQQYGVIVSGAMDSVALRVTNLLVENEQNDAALEITLSGPSLRFEQDALIAIGGGDLSPCIDGQPVPASCPVWIRNGSVLDFGAPASGCRAYLAVSGGFDVPIVMGSRSTYLRAQLGGFDGRPLKKGDLLKLRPALFRANRLRHRLSESAGVQSILAANWSVGSALPGYVNDPTIRVMLGSHHDWLTEESRVKFFSEEFKVTSQSDRMGYRLAGHPIQLSEPRELISEAVTAGTVQIPPDGQPIVLLADHPTTGGYAKIAQVATVDLSLLAQVKPGARIRFRAISVEDAQDLYRRQEAMLRKLECGIALTNNAY